MKRSDWINRVHQGDAISVLKKMPDNLVHCSLTSPPYFRARDYNEPDQMGQEEIFHEYIDYLKRVGTELKRVMRSDGSFFLNLGDKFSQSGKCGLPRKNKLFIPHRTAIAYQEIGWISRGDYVWTKKGAGKPTSAKDRLSEQKEYIFHLVLSSNYYFDLDTIREPHEEISIIRMAYGKREGKHQTDMGQEMNRGREPIERVREGAGIEDIREKVKRGETSLHPLGKNPNDILDIAPETKLHEVHFAPFSKDLIRPLIKAGTPEKVCSNCEEPYIRPDPREVEEVGLPNVVPQCDCNTGSFPGVIMDFFMGSGTTAVVARELNRRWIGIELKEEYCKMTRDRVNNTTVSLERFK